MSATQAEVALWRRKLSEWEGSFEATSELKQEAGEALAKCLADLTEAQAKELIHLFARAFNLDDDEATKYLVYIPKSEKRSKKVEASFPARGFIADYVGWLAEQESPSQYHAFSLLTIISAALARRTCIHSGPFPIFPNIYCILVGPTGARKNGAIGIAKHLVQSAYPPLVVLPKEGSPQGLVSAMAQAQDLTGTAGGLLSAEELRVLVGGKKESYKSELPIWLTDWFDSPDRWDRGLAQDNITLQNVCISIIAGTTLSWFKEMPIGLLQGGFLPRSLIVNADGKKHWKLEPVINREVGRNLAAHVTAALTEVPDQMLLSPAARIALSDWYEVRLPRTAAKVSEARKDFLERAHLHVYKLAMCLNILSHAGAEISVDTITYAIDLIQWLDSTLDEVISLLNTDEKQMILVDIMSYITSPKREGRPLSEKEIVRGLRNKYKSKEVMESLNSLVYQGDLHRGSAAGNRVYTVGQTPND